ncbi:MAG: phosphotransferase [Rhizomicrobium sp.]
MTVHAHQALLQPARSDDAQVVQALRGHSGAGVALCTRFGESFVRKTACDAAGNLRLRRQAIKQRLLAAQGFAFPPVRRIAQDAQGRAFFEMDYIPARTLAELVAHAVPFDRDTVVEAVGGLVRALAAAAAGPIPQDLFHRKIADIVRQSETLAILAPHRLAIAALGGALSARDWSGVPHSPDHGDLTLENILVPQDGRAVFLDCDAAWVSSAWLDLAKLFQDIGGLWFLRAAGPPSVDALERLSRLGEQLRALAGRIDPGLPPRLNQFAALHLFRTLPYTRDAGFAAFALTAADRLLGLPS